MMNDPIVNEVRRVRARILRECGNDLGKVFERARETAKKYKAGKLTVAKAKVAKSKPSRKSA